MRPIAWCVTAVLALCIPTPLLAESVEMRITVLNADGSPVSSGNVYVADYGTSVSSRGVYTFECSDLAPGEHYLSYESYDGIIALRTLRVPEKQRVVKAAVRLGAELVVHGRVTAGKPPGAVPKAQMSIEDADGTTPRFHPHTIRASDEGTFMLDGKAFSGVYVSAFPLHCLPSPRVQVAPPYPMHMNLYCPPEAVVAGEVLDEHGSPLAKAAVGYVSRGYGGSYWADEKGHFEIRTLQPGEYRFTVGAQYHVPEGETIVLQEGQQVTGLVFRLQAAPQVMYRGRVVDPAGAGIAGAKVTFSESMIRQGLDGKPVRMWVGGGSQFTYAAASDELGDFSLALPWREDDPHGHVWFPEVQAEGYLPRDFSVRIDREATKPGVFRMYRGGRVSGTVIGAPQGAEVEIQVQSEYLPPLTQSQSTRTYRRSIDDRTGCFDFGLVLPGEPWLAVMQNGNTLLQQQARVREGEETTVTLTLPPSRSH